MKYLRTLIMTSILLLFGFVAWAGTSTSASITAQNTFTDAFASVPANIRMSVSISGTYVATVTLQRMCDGTNWRDIQSWTSTVAEVTYHADENCSVRIGVKTGDFTSGTAVLRLGMGG